MVWRTLWTTWTLACIWTVDVSSIASHCLNRELSARKATFRYKIVPFLAELRYFAFFSKKNDHELWVYYSAQTKFHNSSVENILAFDGSFSIHRVINRLLSSIYPYACVYLFLYLFINLFIYSINQSIRGKMLLSRLLRWWFRTWPKATRPVKTRRKSPSPSARSRTFPTSLSTPSNGPATSLRAFSPHRPASWTATLRSPSIWIMWWNCRGRSRWRCWMRWNAPWWRRSPRRLRTVLCTRGNSLRSCLAIRSSSCCIIFRGTSWPRPARRFGPVPNVARIHVGFLVDRSSNQPFLNFTHQKI